MRITLLSVFLLLLCCIQLNAQPLDDRVNILTMADIHFDPFIYCNYKTPCPIVDKLSQAPVSQWGAILAPLGDVMPQFKQDSNYSLLRSALDNAKEVALKENPHFILILGDSIGHDFRHKYAKYVKNKSRTGYHQFVYKTLAFLNYELKRTFPTKDIYQVVGNNDSYTDNYVTIPNGPFFSDIGQLWSGAIKNPVNRSAMQRQFAAAGYYALDIPGNQNLRLIVLNTNLFSYHASKRMVPYAAQQLNWLHQQLQYAKQHNKKVILAMHIPQELSLFDSLLFRLFTLLHLWKEPYVTTYNAEIKEFAPQITAIFAGHLHADWFQTLKIDALAIPQSGTPALSPVYGTNPGYKTYTFDVKNNALLGFTTHQYPLSTARISGMNYNFSSQFANLDCQDSRDLDGTDLIQQTSLLSQIRNQFGPASLGRSGRWSAYYRCMLSH